jgi:hypothetical protein
MEKVEGSITIVVIVASSGFFTYPRIWHVSSLHKHPPRDRVVQSREVELGISELVNEKRVKTREKPWK